MFVTGLSELRVWSGSRSAVSLYNNDIRFERAALFAQENDFLVFTGYWAFPDGKMKRSMNAKPAAARYEE